MPRIVIIFMLIGLLSGCGAPSTTAEHPTNPQPAPPLTVVPTTALEPAPSTPTSAVTPSPATAPTTSAPPTSTALPVADGTDAMVRGTITYPDDATLPEDAVLDVKLMPGMRIFHYPEMTEALGEQRISPLETGVVPFEIAYDPDAINPMLSYKVVAELTAGGKRLFSGAAEVITNNQPTEVNIPLHPHPSASAVTGSLTYPSDPGLPPDAVLTIRLQTPVDGVGGPHLLAEQRVSPVGAAPIPFSLPVDPATLDPYASYRVFAVLEAPGRLPWFAAEQPVLTWGAPTTAELALQQPANSALLSGLVNLPESSALPAEAVLSVQIASIYNGTIGSTLHEHKITPAGASPIPYAIEYTQNSFQPSGRYALYASVRLHEKLLFTSPLVPLNTAAMPSDLDLNLDRPAEIGTVRGTVRYNSARPLPPDARLFVQLADTAAVGGDGVPIVIATQAIAPINGEPLNFAIEYDPLAIGPSRYSIYAEIRAGDTVLFRSQGYDVITNGNPTEVEVALQPAQ